MPRRPKHSVSVAAVIVDPAGHILITRRRDNRTWEPPGGILERRESILDGLRREVREETGLDVEPERLTGVYKNMPKGIVALVFRAHVTGGTLSTSDETCAVEWWTADDVKEHIAPAYAVRILDALAGTEPAVRAHDGVRLLEETAAVPL